MFKQLRVYKLGDMFKYISIPVSNSLCFDNKTDYINFKNSNQNSNEKLYNNLIRAKTTIKNLIMCNDFEYFITITFNQKHDRYNLTELRKKLNYKIRYYRYKYKLDIKFLFIAEKHKNGAWHFHGVISGISSLLYVNKNGYNSVKMFDSFGWQNISAIKDKNKCSSYITKYVTKDTGDLGKEKHIYFASQGLKRPILVEELTYNNNTFDSRFFPYSNDYCSLRYDEKLYGLAQILK